MSTAPSPADVAQDTRRSTAGQDTLSAEAVETIRARLRSELSDLDYVRSLVRWARTGVSQREIARQLHVSQAAISKALGRHVDTALAASGFAGATPMEVCKRYAAGQLSRTQLVEQLVAFPYAPMPELTGWEDPVVLPPGTWAEVELAHHLRFIDIDIYDEVLTQQEANSAGVTAYRDLTGEAIEPATSAQPHVPKHADAGKGRTVAES